MERSKMIDKEVVSKDLRFFNVDAELASNKVEW